MTATSLTHPPSLSRATEAEPPMRSGFCALIGRPNVGKSTLINRLVGEKVAIVTPKPQTTRHRVTGIVARDGAQIALLDTPGLAQGSATLLGALRRTAAKAASDADVTVVVAEVSSHAAELSAADNHVLATARRGGGPIILALNKVDLLADKRWLLPWTQAYAEANELVAVVPISAKRGLGLDTLIEQVTKQLPEGPALFDTDLYTTQSERDMCAELVREQLLWRLQAEVPHCLHVVMDAFDDDRENKARPMCHLTGRIIVARNSQKAIVIGDKGRTIREVSTHARQNIERLVGCQVFLRLTVEVDAKWLQSPQALRGYGLMAATGDK